MNILELWSLFYSYPISTYGWRRVVRFGRRFSVAKPGFQPSVKNGRLGLCMTVRLNPSLDWCVWRCLKMSEDVWSLGSCCGCKIIYIRLYKYGLKMVHEVLQSFSRLTRQSFVCKPASPTESHGPWINLIDWLIPNSTLDAGPRLWTRVQWPRDAWALQHRPADLTYDSFNRSALAFHTKT